MARQHQHALWEGIGSFQGHEDVDMRILRTKDQQLVLEARLPNAADFIAIRGASADSLEPPPDKELFQQLVQQGLITKASSAGVGAKSSHGAI